MGLLTLLRSDLEKYAPICQDSVRANQHMNEYDGHVRLVADVIKPWLDGFCQLFVARYRGGSNVVDMAMGMTRCARVWAYKSHENFSHSDQDTRNAVLTDFINFFASTRGVDFALYAMDLKQSEPGDEAYALDNPG